MSPKDADEMANSVDTLGLQCLPRPMCPKTGDRYGNVVKLNLRIGNCKSLLLLL